MARGDHIYVDRGLYTHHGIDLGDGTVIDFGTPDGAKNNAVIHESTLHEFTGTAAVKVRSYTVRHDPEQAVLRARSRLGCCGYDLLSNNCEHFATWCVTGEHASIQVQTATSSAGILGAGVLGPRVGVELITNLGAGPAMSAPNLMSGLARVGGNPLGGIAVLSGTSALLAAGAVSAALPDKPTLTQPERSARRCGRYGGAAGAAGGVWLSLHAVGALGAPGCSAAGLSSGLAALGAFTGGGMAHGVAATLGIPVLLAVVLGYLLYHLARSLNEPRPAGGGTLTA